MLVSVMLVALLAADDAPATTGLKGLFPSTLGDYDDLVATDEFTVLDIDFEARVAVFRHVYRKIGVEHGNAATPVECGYPGMKQFPKSGVVIGFYDLRTGSMTKHYVVYRAAVEKADCTTQADAERALSAAKDHARSIGLSLSDAPLAIAAGQNGEFRFRRGSQEMVLRSSWRRATDGDFETDPILKELPQDDAMVRQVILGEIVANGHPVYRVRYSDYWHMGSQGEITFPLALTNGGEIVFVERYHHHNNFAEGVDRECFGFSPVLSAAQL